MGTVLKNEEFNPYDYEGSPAVDVVHGYLAMFFGLVFFSIVNYLAILIGPSKKMKGDIWRWRNTLVSWIHADIMGVGVLYCLLFKPEVFSDDMILYCDNYIYFLISISVGYFWYDFFDHVFNGKVVSNYEVILHHFAVIWSFGYTVQYKVNAPYCIIALMVEVNSIFLHARKLMQFNQWPFSHWLYKTIVCLNLITFLVFRFSGVALVGVGIYYNWYRITSIYQFFVVISMVVMSSINPILFWRLAKTDVLRRYRRSVKKDHLGTNGFNGTDLNQNGDVLKQH